MDDQEAFLWTRQEAAEAALLGILEGFYRENRAIATLQEDLKQVASTRLFDWVDHFAIPDMPKNAADLESSGFIQESSFFGYRVMSHPGAQLPKVLLIEGKGAVGVAVSVESIADFLMVRGISLPIEGCPYSSYRRCRFSEENGVTLWVVERRGSATFDPTYPGEGYLEAYWGAKEKWQCRPRALEDEDEAMNQTLLIAKEICNELGPDLAAALILSCEREYWQSRNRAAQLQKGRQDRLGMGWANHDHHTFRSSRRHFPALVLLFEMLGFRCRERFYAGEGSGWGAQVMENPRAKLVLFLDLDLMKDEVAVDFAHQALPEASRLRTVGLWCALHGDSILRAGMHHLEAQFLFDELRNELAKEGIGMMEPFSDFSYLKQAFTEAEMWPVAPERVQRLLDKELIHKKQADDFLVNGAVGSHLENLQRRDGFKGFNQKNVNYIIMRTDPRFASPSDNIGA